jgi:hypothetical protein
MLNVDNAISVHQKILDDYKKEFVMSPSVLSNINHLEEWLKSRIAEMYEVEIIQNKSRMSSERISYICIEEHWNYANEAYLVLIKSEKYNLYSREGIEEFVWDFGEDLYKYCCAFYRRTMIEAIDKTLDEGPCDISSSDSCREFFLEIYETFEERFGRKEELFVDE